MSQQLQARILSQDDLTLPGRRCESMVAGDLEEFRKSLEARTRVPPERILEFLAMSDVELIQQSRVIGRIERRFSGILTRVDRDSVTIAGFLRALDIRVFTRDHKWRNIIAALNQRGLDYDDYRRLALERYLEYLRFRREILMFIHRRRAERAESVPERPSEGKPRHLDTLQMTSILPGDARDTDAFKRPASQLQPMASDKFVRLPRNETVDVTLAPRELLDLFLAAHRFTLSIVGGDLQLVDEQGVTYFLPQGQRTLGRHARNDIIVDTDYREISRFHLVIEWQGGNTVQLTDISTLGTFLAPEYVAGRVTAA